MATALPNGSPASSPTQSRDRGERDDLAFREWKQARDVERVNAQQKAESNEMVPLRLTGSVQVWIPIELMVVVHGLWENVKIEGQSGTLSHEIKVWAAFLKIIQNITPNANSTANSSNSLSPASRFFLLRIGLDNLNRALKGTDIHVVARELSDGEDVIATYYQVASEVRSSSASSSASTSSASSANVVPRAKSALLSMVDEGLAGLFATFAGQGVPWLPELRSLHNTYPRVRLLVEKSVSALTETARAMQTPELFSHGFDIMGWIQDPTNAPSAEYLSSAPISWPMIGLVSMLNYYIAIRVWGSMTPGEVSRKFRGMSGHSQGVTAAVVAAISDTEDQYISNTVLAVRLLLCIGVRIQQAVTFPLSVRTDTLAESLAAGNGTPTPMMVVLHMHPDRLKKHIDSINRQIAKDAPERLLEVGLRNGPRSTVVVGHPESLHNLNKLLLAAETPKAKDLDQSRVPHSKRQVTFATTFLSVSAPFHSQSLKSALAQLQIDLLKNKIVNIPWQAKDLLVPVYATNDGHDLRRETASASSLLEALLLQQVIQPVDWMKATAAARSENRVTHVLDFGPGTDIAILTSRNLEGFGIQVIAGGSRHRTPFVMDKSALFESDREKVPFASYWAKEFAPKLVRRSHDSRLFVDTKFTRVLGKPPLMAAGMTPTSVWHELVSAIYNAGYHGELAGGGLPTEKMFRSEIQSLVEKSRAGSGVTLNLLFLNQRLWNFQFATAEKLAREGVPIEGITIAAGVPSLEKSTELLSSMRSAGMRHVSFKPGSSKAIRQVIQIAKANPESTIILQWTGGRAGGHHSFEDLHEPILSTYGRIRAQKNIILVAGSGFGDSKDSWPYLSGEWSRQFDVAPMPFDAVLLGSRLMVAKEAATSLAAKELLVKTPGVESEAQWEQSYEGVAGGIVTVRSELGEPIHKVATRGLLVWRDFDREFFSLPAEKAAPKILERKDYIIKRLNDDFQKVYFGRKLDGAVVDLDEMTYQEVAYRMVDLMYIKGDGKDSKARWIHPDYMARVVDFAVRIEERFTVDKAAGSTKSILPAVPMLATNPYDWLEQLFSSRGYIAARTQLLCSEDIDWFVQLCRQSGRKPVNFVPLIDRDLEFWFKKDSLWQSEDLDAVQDRDVGRVAILQGPVAVKYSKIVNEPVADILNSIHDGWVQYLLQTETYKDQQKIALVEYIGDPTANGSNVNLSSTSTTPRGVKIVSLTRPAADEKQPPVQVQQLTLAAEERSLPEKDEWLQWLARDRRSWLRALLMSAHIVSEKRFAANYVRKLFEPRIRTVIELDSVANEITEVRLFDSSVLLDTSQPVIRVSRNQTDNSIVVTLHHVKPNPSSIPSSSSSSSSATVLLPLTFRLKYDPTQGSSPIHEVAEENRNAQVQRFYAQMWLENEKVDTSVSPADAKFTFRSVVTRAAVERFVRSVNRNPVYVSDAGEKKLIAVPMDFAIVIAWEPLIKSLLLEAVSGDLLQLVHLNNSYRQLSKHRELQENDVILTEMHIAEMVSVEAGQKVVVEGTLALEGGEKLIELQSSFLFRTPIPFKVSFRKVREDRVVHLDSKERLAILQSKSYFKWQSEPKLNDRLRFSIESLEDRLRGSKMKLSVRGSIFRTDLRPEEGERVGEVSFEAAEAHGNVVAQFLRRFGKPLRPAVFFENGGYSLLSTPDSSSAPLENSTYAIASKDYNPIHTNPYFASVAQLPTTITHGMWASANARRVVESFAKNRTDRVRFYHADFVGYVKPRDRLTTQLKHVGMKSGNLLLELRTENGTGDVVLKGQAEVCPPKTAYIFTGQGSAEVNMGMELYSSSAVAKQIWDTADRYLLSQYGFSILRIVRENPKSIELTFGGKAGEAIRHNYMRLSQHITSKNKDGQLVEDVRPLFPDITETSLKYAFKHPEGLLFATQFSQPALVLMELSAFADMRDKGLISEDCIFAGHSLGEYASLASAASVMTIEALVEVVFLRGITMQNAVARDRSGRSAYAMVAVNTARVHPTKFKEPQLQQIIQAILKLKDELLQVVNYNVDNYQYVVAGERGQLNTLAIVLNELKRDPAGALARIEDVIKKALAETEAARDETGWITLDRSIATIPLPGIDVPFHSQYLKPGVPAFRQILLERVKPHMIDERKLIGRYIPNVTAQPFEVSRAYVERVLRDTQSPLVQEILEQWAEWEKNPQKLAHSLLVELLAYQFASPVRWIETQHLFFTSLAVERVIEIGPAPTLFTMAKRTLEQGNYSPLLQREILWYQRDRSTIYYQNSDAEVEMTPTTSAAATSAITAPAPAAASAPAPAPAVAAAPPAPVSAPPAAPSGAQIAQPLTPLEVLRVILALKTKKSLALIPPTVTIRETVGGKSAMQNEIVGDLQKEFGSEPDNAADMDLTSLAARWSSSYAKPGPFMTAQIAKMISSKMPGGFGPAAVRTHLASRYNLSDSTIDGVLVQAVASQPANRLQTEAEAKSWLDTVVSEYATAKGISISSGSAAGGGAGGGAGVAVVDSAALKALEARQHELLRQQLKAMSEFVGEDSHANQRLLELQTQLRETAEAQLKLWVDEHGEQYGEGIRPVFDARKERRYNSSWNWVVQDCLQLYYDYSCGRATKWGPDIRERLYHIKNRATQHLLTTIEYYAEKSEADGHPEIKRFISILADTIRASIEEAPKYRELDLPSAPVTQVDENGGIKYQEQRRQKVKDMLEYVAEMERGSALLSNTTSSASKSEHDEKIESLLKDLHSQYAKLIPAEVVAELEAKVNGLRTPLKEVTPLVFLRSKSERDPSDRVYSKNLTQKYLSVLRKVAGEGVCFQKQVVLITGCGKGSIGLEMVKGLLRGGAKVYATTSRWSPEAFQLYQRIYDEHGAKQSELVILPFNQASVQDVQAIVDHIYEKHKDDIDFVIPFAATSENGRDIGALDSHSELSHRIMLINLLRLIGAVKNKKEKLKIVTHPAHVLLPLSPNHGIFGFDGLYAESKLGLEALLNKWQSENWKTYLSIAGAVIGWTRGTALMHQNNIIAEGIEKLGARTFSTKEMCFNLISLLHPTMVAAAQDEPLLADLNGALHLVKDLNIITAELRSSLSEEATLKKAITVDSRLDNEVLQGRPHAEAAPTHITPRANVPVHFADLPSAARLKSLEQLRGMVDLDRVVVVVGFGETGPYGNARTRWEMEAYGEFSMEGCIELAWMMGLITYSKDPQWTGWIDRKSKEKVRDHEIKARYEETILKHTGIRIIEPDQHDGYDPNNKVFYHTVALDRDMNEVEVSSDEAKKLKHQHGDKVEITHRNGVTFFKLKKGAVMYVPKALKFDRFVAGQVPTNWDPAVFGVPQDIINQVDRVTLYSLVSTVEALVSAGVTDPYEFYEYVHVSEIGNTIGSGLGGAFALRKLHLDRPMEKPVQADILQESFINTMPAWLNMLLLSSSGPIKTPVGACATAVESVEIGVDTIRSGRAKICIVGGYDDYSEHGAYEFAQMKATINNYEDMTLAGRTAREQSRPTTSTRAGFVEAHGSGIEILMNASLAIRMGVPIYAVVEHVQTSMDKIGRSVPAPGQGILTTAREAQLKFPSPLLDLSFRRRQLDCDFKLIAEWEKSERENVKHAIEAFKAQLANSGKKAGTPEFESDVSAFSKEIESLLSSALRQKQRQSQSQWGNDFYVNNPHISPLRGALAVYGLTVDDIAVASFHGTSTKYNDLNESQVLQKQLVHLGRKKGNIILGICQKYLTGHPKGAAAAWMLNGMIQSMLSGIVPGNRNADNIDAQLQECDFILFPNRSIHTYGFKAGLLKSFGFGQVGGEVLVIHPDYILSQLSPPQLAHYAELRERRRHVAFRHWQDALCGKKNFVRVKDEPPYVAADESKVYLNPLARARYTKEAKTWRFVSSKQKGTPAATPLPPESVGGASLTTHNIATQALMTQSPLVPSHASAPHSTSAQSRPRPSRTPSAEAHELAKQSLKRALSGSALTHLEVTMREVGEGLRETNVDRGIGVDAQLISEIEVAVTNPDFLSRNFTNAEISFCRAASDPSSSFAGRWAAKEAVVKALSSSDISDQYSRNLWSGGGGALRDIEILPAGSGAPKVLLHGHAKDVATTLGVSSIKVSISHSGEYAIAQAIVR